MPLTIKTKPSLIRKLKRDRTEIRRWAKGRSEAVQARVAMSEWQPISTAPRGSEDFFLVCGVGDDRSPFVVRGDILWSARKPNTPSHLHLHYLTHWMPLPEPPHAPL